MSETDPKRSISVLMPVYNQANFITRAIESLKLQTCTDWELIIINDGSTDDLHKKVSAYLDHPQISYFENEVNVGLGAALNQGLQ
ncbi:MAG: glycosyltransferase family 2 protein, partial [Sphingobacteriaceae bacterium]